MKKVQFNFFDNSVNVKAKKENNINAEEELKSHQKILEHYTGFYDLIKFINKMKYQGANIKIEKNIIYLDSIASSHFFMINGFERKYHNYKTKKTKIQSFPPSITCKYDFIHLINWEAAYIYKEYLYLVASRKPSNTVQFKNINHFTLAIMCNMPEKFKMFENSNQLDFRKIKFDYDEDEDEQGNIIQYGKLKVEENYVEKSIKCMILNEKNKDIIYENNEKQIKQELDKYQKLLSSKVDEKVGKYMNQFLGAFQFYEINIDNKAQRDYELEEKDFAEKTSTWSENEWNNIEKS